MTDIRSMSNDEINQLNKGKKMPKVKNTDTPVKPRAPCTTTPINILGLAEQDEIEQALNQADTRSEFTKQLDGLEELSGLKVEADINRIRNKVSVFAKRVGRKFVVRPGRDAGTVIVVRIQATNGDNE